MRIRRSPCRGRLWFAQHLKQFLVEPVALLKSFRRTCHISNQHVDSRGRGFQILHCSRAEPAEAAPACPALPLLLSEIRVLLGLCCDNLLNPFKNLVHIFRRRQTERDFVPHPLTARREVEVLTANGKAIHEGDSSSGWESLVCKCSSFEQRSVEQANL